MRSRSEHYSTDHMDRVGDEWRTRAACRDHDPEWWFALPGTPQRAWAIDTCQNDCPVTATCLRYALDYGERYGIWGGVTEEDRRELAGDQPKRRPGRPSPHLERVVEMAGRGDTDQEIADACGLAVNSVKKLRERHGIPAGRSHRATHAQREWLLADDRVLLRMRASGATDGQIGAVLGRSESAIRRRRGKLAEVSA